MIKDLFGAICYDPLYNLLVFLIGVTPGGDVGVAVILTTLLVKILLLPLLLKSAKTQLVLREIEPKIKEIRERLKTKQEEQARAILALYKEKQVNPFSVLLPILIQTPFLLALFFIFARGGLPDIKLDLLYSFVSAPGMVDMHLFGFFNVSEKNLILALVAALSQFVFGLLSLPKLEPRKEDASFKDDFARSFQVNMRYILPGIIGIFAYYLPAAVAISWIAGNIFSIGQEWYVRRRFGAKTPIPTPQKI